MAHKRTTYRYPWSNDHEFHWKGNYGAKGEKRSPRTKKTSKEIEYQNRWNKSKKIRRLLKMNFEDGIFLTLTYQKGMRKPMEEVKRDCENFRTCMRRAYTKMGIPFKYIYCIEIGSRGGIHIHMVINRTDGSIETEKLVSQKWKHGHPNVKSIYESDDDYEQLACYMAKMPEESDKKEDKGKIERMVELTDETYCYGTSRNLDEPEVEHKTYLSYTVKKMIREGPKPTPGYYIDKNSIRTGVNRFTGMSYLYYTEHLIKKKRRE